MMKRKKEREPPIWQDLPFPSLESSYSNLFNDISVSFSLSLYCHGNDIGKDIKISWSENWFFVVTKSSLVVFWREIIRRLMKHCTLQNCFVCISMSHSIHSLSWFCSFIKLIVTISTNKGKNDNHDKPAHQFLLFLLFPHVIPHLTGAHTSNYRHSI